METMISALETRTFMNEEGDKLTLPEILRLNKTITYVIVICPPETIEVKAKGIKGMFGLKETALRHIYKELTGDLKINIIDDGDLWIAMALTDKNVAEYNEIPECREEGIQKNFIYDDANGRPLKLKISFMRIKKLGWK